MLISACSVEQQQSLRGGIGSRAKDVLVGEGVHRWPFDGQIGPFAPSSSFMFWPSSGMPKPSFLQSLASVDCSSGVKAVNSFAIRVAILGKTSPISDRPAGVR